MKIQHSSDYAALRAREYPSLRDLADALVAQAGGDPAPMKAYVARCLAIKAKYPKPPKGPNA